ncbi:hypothetical protein EIN_224320 [Entamoeba invadens IP1]|uniref:Uncharacterized protein n=1 Tax=Entamoeba invadens IP1 TaxID=370355 RepID=A0A0A1U2D1_ENTIV|nr:hypothetical protein EIN_224320 [Entamoeba invadens IP1]ELP88189.1 hypothetical protein EIN_224320 [Entamoeba invadens IP1]|eukprot:XP_004254960.1 hypothetical protein EIN_224320 [Entamoeba invadens IP1]
MAGQVTLKILVLGDSFVGKTSLINQFVNRKYSCDYKSTVGVDLSTRQISIEDKMVCLNVWDPSGTERFRCVSDNFFRGTDGCILVCSLTSKESFEDLASWKDEIVQRTSSSIPFVAVANKSDVDEMEWQLTTTRFESWCDLNNFPHFLVSAKDATNVENAFVELSKTAMNATKIDPTMFVFYSTLLTNVMVLL